ncbi:MAG: RDD family protein [Planctomycetales bacterium]
MSPLVPPASAAPTVSLDLRIETPENVVLTYQLAGPAARVAAYAIDFALRAVLFFGVLFMVSCSGLAIFLPGTSMGLVFLLWFALQWGYFVVCEGFFNGTTIGKHAFGLRAIHERGHPLTLWSAMLRNLLRAADSPPIFGLSPMSFVPLYGPALISMVLSRKMQRLGDLAAGSVVISERQVVLPIQPVILERIAPLSRDELGSTFVPSSRTLSLIDRFLSRRAALSHERGHDLASLLARAIARRIGFRGDPALVEQYPMAFLARAYVTFTRRDEEAEAEQAVEPVSPRFASLEAVR